MASTNTTFGATIVSTPEPSSHQLPHPITDSPALTPAVSRTTLGEEFDASRVPPHSPFYQHPPSSNELSLPLPSAKHGKVHEVYEKDLESGNDTPLTPTADDEHPFSKKMVVEHTKECQMWPSTQTLKQKYKEDKKQRREARGGCCTPVRTRWSKLSARNRLLLKIALALFVVGIAVALGVGISTAVKGSYYVNDGKSNQVQR